MFGFSEISESEKFVRKHALFVTTYFSIDPKTVYCNDSDGRHADVIASGEGKTAEVAWDRAAGWIRVRLSRLEALQDLISEVDNSELPSKFRIGVILRKKYKKLGKGISLG